MKLNALHVTPRKPGSAEKDAFVQRLTKLVALAVREVERTHGDPQEFASSVAKRVATRLWALHRPDQHPDIPAWVKHVRGQLGLSQEEFAGRLGVHRVTVAKWETGALEPTPDHREAIGRLATND